MTDTVERLLRWHFASGIYISTGALKGAVNNGYSWRTQRYEYVYNEITGYALSLCAYMVRKTQQATYRKYGTQIARYLLAIQDTDPKSKTYGAYFHGYQHPQDEPSSLYYTFDNFIIMQGLLDWYGVTGDQALIDAAERVARWIQEKLAYPDTPGAFYARYDRATGRYGYPTGKFSGDAGILEGKMAIAFLKLARHTKRRSYRVTALAALDYALTLQQSDGWFWANRQQEYVFTHAQCYVSEGLIYAWQATKEQKYKQAFERSLCWMRSQLETVGDAAALRHIYHDQKSWRRILFAVAPYYTTDATSQYVRLVELYAQLEGKPEILEQYRVSACIRFITNSQIRSSDHRLDGALPHKMMRRWVLRRMSPIISTWCAQFSVQALLEYESPTNFIESLY